MKNNSVVAAACVFAVCVGGLLSIHLLSEPGEAGPTELTTAAVATASDRPVDNDNPVTTPPEPTPPSGKDPGKPIPTESRPPAVVGRAVVEAVRRGGSAVGVGVYVVDAKSGQELAVYDADRQFRSASLVKLLLAMDAMQAGVTNEAEISRMLSLSHDQIANSLWMKTGGNTMVVRQARRMGLARTLPPLDPTHWGDTKVTARDMAKVYRYILTQLPARQRDLIMKALTSAPRVAADGYDQHFGIPNGLPDVQWAIKQGWAIGRAATDLHTSGVVDGGTIVVILTTHASGTGYPKGMRAVTDGAAALKGLFS